MTPEGRERTFALNHLAYFVLTQELLPLLQSSAPSRIVNVSSDAHLGTRLDFDDLDYARGRYRPFVAYGRSKLMNILFTRELARRLAGTGVTVNAMHPGFVRSGFAQNNAGVLPRLVKVGQVFARTPEKGAETLVYLALSPVVEGVTGKYFYDLQERRSSPAAQDMEAARRLWEVSAQARRSGRRRGMRKTRGVRRRTQWLFALLAGLVILAVVPFSSLGREARVRGVEHGAAAAPLRAGAAVVEMAIPFPVPAVGYGLVRPEVSRAAHPVSARAVVMVSEDEKVGLVTLDLLLVDVELVDEVRQERGGTRALGAVGGGDTHPRARRAALRGIRWRRWRGRGGSGPRCAGRWWRPRRVR